MKPNLYRLTALIILILITYLFIQPVYLSSEKRWSLICKTCNLAVGDSVIMRIGASSVTSLGIYIADNQQKINLSNKAILVNGENIYTISNNKIKNYQKQLVAGQTFIIKKSKSTSQKNQLVDYGTIPTDQIIGKLIL